MQILKEIHTELTSRLQELEAQEKELCQKMDEVEKKQYCINRVLEPLEEMFGEKTEDIKRIK